MNRALASGAIRFGVTERAAEAADRGEGLSTGPSGEYLRRREDPLFFADGGERPAGDVGSLAAAARREQPLVPWWGWASIGFGALLVVLGILVVINKGYRSGYVESAVGLAFVALPFVLGAKKRRDERARRERERAEREAAEAELRMIAGAFVERLAALRSAGDAATLDAVRAAREGKEIPYERVRPAVRAAVRRVAFDALVAGEGNARAVADAIDRAAAACGATDEDVREIRLAVVQKAWWHLLADDRFTPERLRRLEEIRAALGIPEEAIAVERKATAELDALRGIGPRSLPEVECGFRLRALERCVHVTRVRLTHPKVHEIREPGGARRIEERWHDRDEHDLAVTTQRILLRGGKDLDLDVRSVWDLEVDVERSIVALLVGGEKKRTWYLRVPDPIYTAGVIQAAAAAPLKPKGLV